MGRKAQLASKGSLTEEVYNITVNGFARVMDDIDACLQGKGKEVDAQGVSPINTENAFSSGNNKSVKGIKTKERFRGTSTRPKGVLERRRKKKKVVEPDEPSSQNLDCELPSFQSCQLPTYVACNASERPTSNMGMMELLQAQLSGFEHGHGAIDGSNSQSQDQ
ncbi:protein FAR1-RELATED SEQUENCE 5-like [Sesbania bispinosa]|nr:protein FAR1-RELATED SEQUENCE 5-like [Sesbania bispinosa]